MSRTAPPRLRAAIRKARMDLAEQSGVVVDLRDAELARLELLDDALKPIFAEVPTDVDLFDPGVTPGETPRLWIDAVTHVAMGRDKRRYRLLHDTRFGRTVLEDSPEIDVLIEAVTRYVAQRLVERQRALADDRFGLFERGTPHGRFRGLNAIGLVALGMVLGAAAILVFAYLAV